jgi:hypothetical protein
MKGVIVMKGKLKRILSLALLAALLAGAVNLPLPGLSPAARAEDDFNIWNNILVGYTGPGGIVRIPRKVRIIGKEVFSWRGDITGVVIPDTVTAIWEKAFYHCSGLKVLAVPNTVKTIGEWAFASCSRLKKVTLPKGVTKIGEGAFYGCRSLKKVTLPKGVTEIGGYAFSYCTRLTDVTIPNTVDVIGEDAFDSCVSLKRVIIPDSVTEIGTRAFCKCTSLAGVKFGNGLDKIWDNAFAYCIILKDIILPSSVTFIGQYAFGNCTGLTSVVIPDSVSDIAADAFDDCPNLRFVTLPSAPTALDFVGSNPVKTVIPDNLLPPAVFLREGQRMVLPKFKGAEVEWSVAGEPIAEIINNNVVRGVARGDAILRMTVAQAAQGKALTLNGQPLKPGKAYDIGLKVLKKGEAAMQKVAINGPRKLTLHPLGRGYGYPATAKLDLVLIPASLPWSWKEYCFYISSNPGVAQVLGDGTIVAVKPGKAVITAYTPNMKTAEVTVTVKGWVTSLRLKDEYDNYVNRMTLIPTSEDEYILIPVFNWDAAFKAVRWTSSNPRVANVDWNGYVYGNSKGTARITAIALDGSGKKATVVVTVT